MKTGLRKGFKRQDNGHGQDIEMSGLMGGGLLNWRLLYMNIARVGLACETRSTGRNSNRGEGGGLYCRTLCAVNVHVQAATTPIPHQRSTGRY